MRVKDSVVITVFCSLLCFGFAGCNQHKAIVSPPQVDAVTDNYNGAYKRYNAERVNEQTNNAYQKDQLLKESHQADLTQDRQKDTAGQPRAAAIDEALTRNAKASTIHPLNPHQQRVQEELFSKPSDKALREAQLHNQSSHYKTD